MAETSTQLHETIDYIRANAKRITEYTLGAALALVKREIADGHDSVTSQDSLIFAHQTSEERDTLAIFGRSLSGYIVAGDQYELSETFSDKGRSPDVNNKLVFRPKNSKTLRLLDSERPLYEMTAGRIVVDRKYHGYTSVMLTGFIQQLDFPEQNTLIPAIHIIRRVDPDSQDVQRTITVLLLNRLSQSRISSLTVNNVDHNGYEAHLIDKYVVLDIYTFLRMFVRENYAILGNKRPRPLISYRY
jgi:hypothetical protein